MRSTLDRITRRDALARLAATGAAWAWARPGRGADDQGQEGGPPARIYVATSGRPGEFKPEVSGILAIDPKDGTWMQIAPEPNTSPRVSPDGRRLICYRNRPVGEEGVYVCDAGGGDAPRKVVGGRIARALWSPDGRQIVFVEGKDGGVFKSERVNIDGTNRAAVPIPDTDVVGDWSPDGRWFLTSSRRGMRAGPSPSLAPTAYYLMHPDGTGERRLLDADAPRRYPRFSPDGRAIVYTEVEAEARDFLGGRYRIAVIGVDGEHRRTLLDQTGDESPFMAVWSPDGKELAVLFREIRLEKGEEVRSDSIFTRLEVVSADGQGRRRLEMLDGVRFTLGDWR